MLKRFLCIAALILSIISLLAGCSRSSQVENQAYVLVMGLDRQHDNKLQLSVLVPKISGGGETTEGKSSSGNYTIISVTADDFEMALEKLDWAAPRDLNLSHLKLIILSEKIACETGCRKLIQNIAQTERLFTATRVAVCAENANEFIEYMQPVIGTRVSTDIDAMFEHYIGGGYVPESRLADLYYQTESVYSDPMITYAILDKRDGEQEKENAQETSALSDSIWEISENYKSDIPTRYLGAAVFSEGRMKGILSGTQTIIANLLRNEVDAFRYRCDEQSLEIVPTRHVFVQVNADENGVGIEIDAKLSVSAQESFPDENKLKNSLIQDIESTIRAAMDMGAEPFGFAEKAAKHFLTLDQWLEYNWMERFQDADIEISLSLAHSDT